MTASNPDSIKLSDPHSESDIESPRKRAASWNNLPVGNTEEGIDREFMTDKQIKEERFNRIQASME